MKSNLLKKKIREQSKSELWYRARSGVTTTSSFRACCHKDIAEPLGCSCCETIFAIEIKFPVKGTKMALTELAISDESFCMERVNSKCILKKDNAYYYQVQLQMLLTQAKACYFFVYSIEASLCHMIVFDEVFMAEKVLLAKNFFVYAILPELLGRWYSRTHVGPLKIKENVLDDRNTCTC